MRPQSRSAQSIRGGQRGRVLAHPAHVRCLTSLTRRRCPPFRLRPGRPALGPTSSVVWLDSAGVSPADGRGGQPRPAEGLPSSQPPRGSRAVYASWTTSFLPCPYGATGRGAFANIPREKFWTARDQTAERLAPLTT